MTSATTGCRIGPIVHSIASSSSAAPMETEALARCSCIAYRKACSACVNAVAIRTMAAILSASPPCADPNAAIEIDVADRYSAVAATAMSATSSTMKAHSCLRLRSGSSVSGSTWPAACETPVARNRPRFSAVT